MDTLKDKNVSLMPFGNRSISSSGIHQMKHSIARYGIVRPLVLIKTTLFDPEGTSKLYIADGQHLFMACQGLNKVKQLPYIICKEKFSSVEDIVKFVATLNSTQRGWKLVDYVGAYASTNQNLNYNVLENKYQKYGLPYRMTAMVYGGYGAIPATDAIKDGSFVVHDQERGDKIAEILQDVILLFGRKNSTQLSSFTLAFYHWYAPDKYNHASFIKYLKGKLEDIVILDSEGAQKLLRNYKK